MTLPYAAISHFQAYMKSMVLHENAHKTARNICISTLLRWKSRDQASETRVVMLSNLESCLILYLKALCQHIMYCSMALPFCQASKPSTKKSNETCSRLQMKFCVGTPNIFDSCTALLTAAWRIHHQAFLNIAYFQCSLHCKLKR